MCSKRSPIVTVDVVDGGTVQGDGPLFNVIGAEVVTELDRAGQVTVTVPALDDKAIALVDTETEIHINVDGEGVLGKGLLQTWSVNAGGRYPTYDLTGPDLLGELAYLTTGYDALYDNKATATDIIGTTATATSLLGSTGWTQGTVTIAADMTPTTITFNGETRLSALITLCKQIGHHFRQGTTARTLDVDVFGSDSGFRIVNVDHFRVGQESSTVSGYITGLRQSSVSADIENKLFPLGKDKFDLRDTSTSITDIEVQTQFGLGGFATTTDGLSGDADVLLVTATTDGTRSFRVGEEIWVGDADDWTTAHEYAIIESISAGTSITLTTDLENHAYAVGSDVIQRPQFYIYDQTSIDAYGTREALPQYPWIGFSKTSADSTIQEQASAALYHAAKERLSRYKDPLETYAISDILDLPTTLQVGDKIRLTYRGNAGVGGSVYLNVNDDFYVMKISRRWDGSGKGGKRGISKLEVSNVLRTMPQNRRVSTYLIGVTRQLTL